jgi:tRNA pseudouridine38-40 synthase
MTAGGDAASVSGPSLDAVNGPSTVRLRLDIAYDGTAFAGWAQQPDQRTVQGVMQSALAAVLRLPGAALTVAGRTDSGVHATGQVAHLDVPAQMPVEGRESLLRSLAGVLPADVRVLAVRSVPDAFDARFGALWRRYEYRISDSVAGADPLRRGFVLDHRRLLDVAAMSGAASALLGLNDYAAFCKRREGSTTTRCVQTFTVERDGIEIVARIQADAFCHSMVRSLIGALIAVGEGRRPPDWPATLLNATERANDVMVAAPHGLTLVEVGYPPDDELAARTQQTRARRD